MHVERRIDDAGAILHDSQTHAAILTGLLRDSDPVVLDRDGQSAVIGFRADHDPTGPCVLHRIIDRFLNDAVEIRGQDVVVNLHRFPAIDTAIDTAVRLRLSRKFLERHHEAGRIDLDGNQALHRAPHAAQGLLNTAGNRLGRFGVRILGSGELLLQAFCQVAQAGQFLAETVVQFATDSLLLAARAFENFAFQISALGNIPRDDGNAYVAFLVILYRRDRLQQMNGRPFLPRANRFNRLLLDRLAASDLVDLVLFFERALGRNQLGARPADGLLFRIAE